MSLSPVFKWLAPLALVFVAYLTAAGTPEETVKAFAEAWNAQDMRKAAGYVVGSEPDADFSALKAAISPSWPQIKIVSITAEATGDKATATTKYSLEGPGSRKEEFTEAVKLILVDGVWLIVPGPFGDSKNNIGIMASLTSSAGLTKVFATAKQAAKKTVCLSNVKQLATGILLLASDNDDVIKINPSKTKATLLPYLKNESLWYCPEKSKTVVAYSFNANLANKSLASVQYPAETVMIYEGSKGKLDFNHDGKAAVGFTDGHAKMIDAEQAKKLRWKP